MTRDCLRKHCEAMCKRFENVPTSGTYQEHKLILDLLNQTEWIPVSEGLPKSHDVYNVTRIIDETRITDSCFYDGSIWYDDTRINHDRKYLTDVIAWMPLPESYKAEGDFALAYIEDTIPMSDIDSIKAEIKTEISDYEGYADFHEGIRFGLRTALKIIDKHSKGRK